MHYTQNKSRKILISIKPEYADKIVEGTKKYEFRTKKPKLFFDYIVIYWTFPKMKILAKAKVDGILEYTPKKMWELTKNKAGISKSNFFEYFKGRDKAYAFKLGKVTCYSKQKKLSDFKINFPPQSFIYLN
jgi:predicted transcriptional regulator